MATGDDDIRPAPTAKSFHISKPAVLDSDTVLGNEEKNVHEKPVNDTSKRRDFAYAPSVEEKDKRDLRKKQEFKGKTLLW